MSDCKKDLDFDLIHSVAGEYFHYHVPNKCGFTHHMGCANVKNMEAVFYLYFDTDDKVDFHAEMKKINEFPHHEDEQKS